jgi:hypothetical protein
MPDFVEVCWLVSDIKHAGRIHPQLFVILCVFIKENAKKLDLLLISNPLRLKQGMSIKAFKLHFPPNMKTKYELLI